MSSDENEVANPKIIVIIHGFYYFGDLIESPKEGYIAIKKAAMFGGFDVDAGLPSVTRGTNNAKVTLNRFDPEEIQFFPENACIGILSCINLYQYSKATVK